MQAWEDEFCHFCCGTIHLGTHAPSLRAGKHGEQSSDRAAGDAHSQSPNAVEMALELLQFS